jgi:putative FmdB family regulatory protein
VELSKGESIKMPTYEYACSSCGERFKVFQSISDSPLTTCTQCGGSVQRLIGGGAGLIFKGSGFYITDYKSKTGSDGDKKTDSSVKPAEKTDKTQVAA